MVHYNTSLTLAQTPPPTCPKCGSHRTEVVGRSDNGTTLVVRCNACGERSRITVTPEAATAEAEPVEPTPAHQQ